MSDALPFQVLARVERGNLVTFVARFDGEHRATERYRIGNGKRRCEVAEAWSRHPKLAKGEALERSVIAAELEAAEIRAQAELDARLAAQPEVTETVGETGQPKEKGPSQSELLVQLALEKYRIGRDERDEAFAVLRDGPNIALMFRGSRDALRAGLSKRFREVHQKTPNASALADALTNLQGEALDAAPEPTFLRIADGSDGSVLVDLGAADGRAIEITRNGWRILEKSPVLFRRTALSAPLPIPKRGGRVDDLRELLNVTDETWPLLVGFMVAAFIPGIAHPILMIGGEAGSGKSTAARLLVTLFDSSTAPLRSQPADVEQWCIAANGSYGVVIDNISGITKWWSDSLCKSATGDGWVRRKLWTDGELAVTSFRRVVILTSIDAGALRGDLGDRLLLCELDRIHDSERISEVELLQAFDDRSPGILGALLDLVSAVLRELPRIELRSGPRMMDFGRILAAIDRVRGTHSLDLYFAQRDSIAADVVEADPVAKALAEFMDGISEWTGITSELLTALTPEHPPRWWPDTPRGFSAKLKHAAPALHRLNIEIIRPERDRSRKRDRRLIVRRIPPETVQTVRPSVRTPGLLEPCVPSVHPSAFNPDGSDDSDGSAGDSYGGEDSDRRETEARMAEAAEAESTRASGGDFDSGGS